MNRYLEKVAELEKEALNALKARAMAHEAGVVVDPDTQWKWALRQFRRGPEGKVAQGRDRAQILNRIMGNPAAGNNNFRQAIQSEQRKLRTIDEVQLHRRQEKVLSRPSPVSRQLRSTEVEKGRYTGRYGDSDAMHGLERLHTNLDSVVRDGDRIRYEVRGTTPKIGGGLTTRDVAARNSASGGAVAQEHEPLSNPNLRNIVDTHVHPSVNKRISRLNDHAYVPEEYKTSRGGYSDIGFRHEGGAHRKASPSGSYYQQERYGGPLFSSRGDLNVFSNDGHIGIPHNIITSPYEDGRVFLGAHRVVPKTRRKYSLDTVQPERVRSAYLDLTPRKARPENPYLDKLHEMGKTL